MRDVESHVNISRTALAAKQLALVKLFRVSTHLSASCLLPLLPCVLFLRTGSTELIPLSAAAPGFVGRAAFVAQAERSALYHYEYYL